jgi:autotransporter-associated beta strand protein
LLAAVGLLPAPVALAVTEADVAQTFPVGDVGFQANVPAKAVNLLSTATLSFSQPPKDQERTGLDYGILVDGSYGTVPASGGGGPQAVSILNNTTLTYSLASPNGYNLSSVDIFTGWGDAGRIWPTVDVRYATAADPFSFVTLKSVDYHPGSGTGAWVNLTDLGIGNVAVSKLQFVFGTQENGYVGYVELAAQGTVAPDTETGKIWSGETNSNWDLSTVNFSGQAFAQGDEVRFKDVNGTGGAVTNRNVVVRAGGVAPSKVTFSNTAAAPYSLTNAPGDTTGITGAASVTVKGGGTVTFNSPNTYTGGTTVVLGTLQMAGTGTLGAASGTTHVGAAGILDLGGTTQTVGQLGSSATIGILGTVQNGTVNVQAGNANLMGGTFSANLTSTPASTARLFIGGDTSATLLLGGNNTLENADGISTKIGDATTGAAGTVKLTSATALGAVTQATQITAGTLDLNGQANVSPSFLVLASSKAGLVNGSATPVTFGSPIFTIKEADANAVAVVGGAGNLTLSNTIGADGGLRKLGAGTLFITGTANNYAGNTIFEGGIVNVAKLADYGQDSSLGNHAAGVDGAVNVNMLFRGGTLQYTGSTPQSTNRAIRISTSGGGTIDASGSTPAATLNFTLADSPDWWENGGTRTFTLTGTNTGHNTIEGKIRDLPGQTVINLQKAGPGTWYLTNPNSTFVGATLFDGGILNVAALSDYDQPGSLGQRSLVDDNANVNGATHYVGLLFHGGTLQYTGSTPTSTNRFIRVGLQGAFIDASGTTPDATMSFTANAKSPDLYEAAGVRTITLTGTNTGANTFSIILGEVDAGTATTTNLAKSGTGTWVIPVVEDNRGSTTVNDGVLRVTGSIATNTGLVVNGGTYEAAASQAIKTATVNSGGTLKVTGAPGAPTTALKLGTNVAGAVPFVANGTGKLDVGNGLVALDLAPSDMQAGLIATRTAILANVNVMSSAVAANPSATGIGYAIADELFGPGGSGNVFGIDVDNSTVFARYTLLGDATLDGIVDFNDLVQLAQNYNTAVSATTDSWWFHGDFTGDGTVDFNDLVKLAQNYNTALPSEAVPGAPAGFEADMAAAFASVPEPATTAWLGIGGAAALAGRRGRAARRP